MASRRLNGGLLCLAALAVILACVSADTSVRAQPAAQVHSGLAQPKAQTQGLAEEGGGEAGGEEGGEEEEGPVPYVPVVPVADNYEAATNADDLITKALEHGTLSAAQAKAILAAAKAAASADAAKVAAAKKIVEAAKDAQGDAAKDAATANEAASKAAGKVAEDEKKLKEDEEAAGPFAAIAQQKQAALNSANQRLAAAMAYAATQTRNMDRALAAETAAKAAEEARKALAKAKEETDSAEIAARNLADVSNYHSSGSSSGGGSSGSKGSNVGEKIAIALFFVLLAGALLFWWFQYGRGSGAESQGVSSGMQAPGYGATPSYPQAGSYGAHDTTV